MIPIPLLILDLDETLIFSSPQDDNSPYDFRIPGYQMVKRPGLDDFLSLMAKHFDLAVWSSATEDYVDEIIKIIFDPEIPLAFVWGRKRNTLRIISRDITGENEWYPQPVFMKRLLKIKKLGHSLERTLIVDDKPAGLADNFGNAIIIKEFTGDPDDRELYRLGNYLMKIKDIPNFRQFEKRNWRTETEANPFSD